MDDYVHVIINDGGDKKVVDDLVAKYEDIIQSRVKVIHNSVSNGMEAASNKAIQSVDSIYVAIHDDDDSWHEDFLKCAVSELEASGGMGVVVTTDRVIEEIDEQKKIVRRISSDRWHPELKEISLYEQCLDNFATPITFLYARKVYEKIGFYDESLPVAGDWDFTIRFLKEYDITYLKTDQALAFYHHRPDASGVNGNTVFAGADKHIHYLNTLMNKYLREDIASGRLGVGYIMNNLRYEQSRQRNLEHYIDSSVIRLERHVNFIADTQSGHIKKLEEKAFGSYISKIKNKLTHLKK
jgi:glycosyltransferase involved in cell wall biosynthesis